MKIVYFGRVPAPNVFVYISEFQQVSKRDLIIKWCLSERPNGKMAKRAKQSFVFLLQKSVTLALQRFGSVNYPHHTQNTRFPDASILFLLSILIMFIITPTPIVSAKCWSGRFGSGFLSSSKWLSLSKLWHRALSKLTGVIQRACSTWQGTRAWWGTWLCAKQNLHLAHCTASYSITAMKHFTTIRNFRGANEYEFECVSRNIKTKFKMCCYRKKSTC